MLLALIIGAVLGFIGSMPVAGPIAVLVVTRGLGTSSRGAAARIAAGAALVESIYAFLAFWGLGAVLHRFPMIAPASRLLGAGLLITVGVYLLRRGATTPQDPPAEAPVASDNRGGLLLGMTITALN